MMSSISGATPANGRIDVFNVTVIRAIICRTSAKGVTPTLVPPNPPGAHTTIVTNLLAALITLNTADPGSDIRVLITVSRVVSPLTAAHLAGVLHPGTLILESYLSTVGTIGVVAVA